MNNRLTYIKVAGRLTAILSVDFGCCSRLTEKAAELE